MGQCHNPGDSADNDRQMMTPTTSIIDYLLYNLTYIYIYIYILYIYIYIYIYKLSRHQLDVAVGCMRSPSPVIRRLAAVADPGKFH